MYLPPYTALNIQKEIEKKCGDGYNIFEHQKHLEFKDKKDQENLRHFFCRVFVINPKERITLNEMFSHALFQINEAETTSDSTDDQLEQDVEMEL